MEIDAVVMPCCQEGKVMDRERKEDRRGLVVTGSREGREVQYLNRRCSRWQGQAILEGCCRWW
jgi:hypothetical protein